MKDEFACGMRSLTPEESEELKNIYKSLSNKVEFAPVIHAKWSDEREYCHNFTCSNCGKLNNNNFDEYCKHCGAKMDKE